MSDIEDLEERVSELNDRVSYLEQELSLYYEKHLFESKVSGLLPAHDTDLDVSDNGMGGWHAFVYDLSTEDLNIAIERLENEYIENSEYRITETSEGLGLEVWTSLYQ